MKTIKFVETDPRRGQVVTVDDGIARGHVLSGAAEEIDGKNAAKAVEAQERSAARLTLADANEMVAQRVRNQEAIVASREAGERSMQRQAEMARERGEEIEAQRKRAADARDPDSGTVARTNDPAGRPGAAAGAGKAGSEQGSAAAKSAAK